MQTRRRILGELRQFQSEWPNSWLAARDMRVYRRDTAGFAAAAAALVAEGLILSASGDHAAATSFRINPARMAELRRELAPPLWQVLLLIAVSLAVGAAAFMTFRAE